MQLTPYHLKQNELAKQRLAEMELDSKLRPRSQEDATKQYQMLRSQSQRTQRRKRG